MCGDFYFVSFPKDYCILKVMVLVQLLLETIQTVTLIHDVVNHFTIAYTGGASSLNNVETLWISIPLMIGLSVSLPDHVDVNFMLT